MTHDFSKSCFVFHFFLLRVNFRLLTRDLNSNHLLIFKNFNLPLRFVRKIKKKKSMYRFLIFWMRNNLRFSKLNGPFEINQFKSGQILNYFPLELTLFKLPSYIFKIWNYPIFCVKDKEKMEISWWFFFFGFLTKIE